MIKLQELNGVEGYDDDGNGYIDDIRGWDFINIDNAPLDDNMHGTHVAGIASLTLFKRPKALCPIKVIYIHAFF